ncbi:transcriptional repressor LexA [Silanimonas lenta]|uniref:transcriptional repressor LexA n=1 Tax=Silanimonas lenta TaxID=265429 RepID=UPI00041E57C6|nr:transcriptional repressor LexA [Silanimonas lenta]GIX38824.1 MAG: LexA repressor 2 [Silanimonas sp.]
MTLTDRQLAILDFLRAYLAAEGRPPTLAEIASAFGFRQARSAQDHLQALAAKGAIELVPGARGIRLRDETAPSAPSAAASPAGRPGRDAMADSLLTLPLLGQVAAGRPIDPQADYEGELLLDRALFFPTPDYLLRVKGDSMRDDGIFDGDLIAVRRCPTAENHQIVVARIDGEITVKRLKRGKDRVLLMPRNPAHAPIEVPAEADFAIEGLYCGLVRRG